MNFKIYYLLFSLYCLTLLSCQKEAEDTFTNDSITAQKTQNTAFTQEQLRIKNNMLCFENTKALDEFLTFTYKLESREHWFETLGRRRGFVSLHQHYNNMLDKINEIESEDERPLLEFVKSNSKYWYIDETDPENKELMQHYDYGKYYFVANKNLEFMVGNQVWNLAKLPKTKAGLVSYNYNQKMMGCNTGNVEGIGLKNRSWCHNDRRVRIELTILATTQNTSFLDAGYMTVVRGQRKFGCIWGGYSTALEWRDVTARVVPTYPNGTTLPSQQLSIADRVSSGDVSSMTIVRVSRFNKTSTTIINIQDIVFERAYGLATSRGVGNIWGVALCE